MGRVQDYLKERIPELGAGTILPRLSRSLIVNLMNFEGNEEGWKSRTEIRHTYKELRKDKNKQIFLFTSQEDNLHGYLDKLVKLGICEKREHKYKDDRKRTRIKQQWRLSTRNFLPVSLPQLLIEDYMTDSTEYGFFEPEEVYKHIKNTDYYRKNEEMIMRFSLVQQVNNHEVLKIKLEKDYAFAVKKLKIMEKRLKEMGIDPKKINVDKVLENSIEAQFKKEIEEKKK